MKFKNIEELAQWNDEMVKKYHKEGTIFESKNFILASIEKKRINEIIKLANIKKEDKILDLGCGEGYLLSLLPKANEIIGMDISKVALDRANIFLKNRQDIKLLFGTAENTKFEKEYFDKILCSEVLEHVPDPKDVMKEIHRILKKDGILVISIPNEKRIQSIFKFLEKTKLKKILFAKRKDSDYEWHLHEADLDFLKNSIHELFSIVKVKRIPIFLGYRFIVKLRKINS